MTDPLSSKQELSHEQLKAVSSLVASELKEARAENQRLQRDRDELAQLVIKASHERDRIRALLRQWELGCTGKHGSQVPCVAREALGPAQVMGSKGEP